MGKVKDAAIDAAEAAEPGPEPEMQPDGIQFVAEALSGANIQYAFPSMPICGQAGLSKLEYFAAQAMLGLLNAVPPQGYPDASHLARDAYAIANALINEASQNNTNGGRRA